MKLVSFLKKRYQFFREKIQSSSEQNSLLLRNGVVPEELKSELETLEKETSYENTSLTFVELTSFNTFFEIFPKKVLGKEVLTSSREFPVTIKATPESVKTAFSKLLFYDKIFIPLPIGWSVSNVTPSPFRVEYSSKEGDLLRVEDLQDKTFALFHFKNGSLKEAHKYDSIQKANYHVVNDHFKIPLPTAPKKQDFSILELEAIALELELQLLKL